MKRNTKAHVLRLTDAERHGLAQFVRWHMDDRSRDHGLALLAVIESARPETLGSLERSAAAIARVRRAIDTIETDAQRPDVAAPMAAYARGKRDACKTIRDAIGGDFA